jgi:fibronectin type 3 domain-containing protein
MPKPGFEDNGTWNPVLGAESYNVYRSTTSGDEGTLPYATNVGAAGFTDSGGVSGTIYYYTVTAVSEENEGAQSAEASAAPGSTQLAAPTLTGVFSSGQVKISWTAVAGAKTYNLYRGDAYFGNLIYMQGLTSTTFIDTNIVNGVNYNYYVYPVSKSGQGMSSNNLNGTP